MSEVIFEFDEDLFNEIYIPYIDNPRYKYILLYGGRAGGRSDFAIQSIIYKFFNHKFFRPVFLRKTFDSIRDSQFQSLIDYVAEWQVEEYFYIAEGKMTFKSLLNSNNILYLKGLDKPAKLKSIKDPTFLWIEEGDEIEEEAFIQSDNSLRTEKADYLQTMITFNPENDKSWIWKRWFDPQRKEVKRNYLKGELSYELIEYVNGREIVSLVLHATCDDNKFVSQDYRDKLDLLKNINPMKYKVHRLGLWGRVESGEEYFPPFKYAQHVLPVEYKPEKPVHLTFDFNVRPYMTLLCAQVETIENVIEVRVFREFCLTSPLNSSKAVCNAFIDHYGDKKPTVFYYGDGSGKNRIPGKGNEYAFLDVEETLKPLLNNNSDRVIRQNIRVFKRRDFVNEVLGGMHNIKIIIDPSCTELINDFEHLQTGPEGKLKVKKDGVEIIGHTSDAFEYLICSIFINLIIK